MVRELSLDVECRFLDAGGAWSMTTLGKVDGADVVRGRPVRTMPTYRGQRNYPGLLWTATTGSLVGYESLLERDRLRLERVSQMLASSSPMVGRCRGLRC